MTFANEGSWDRVIRIVVGFALSCGAWLTWPSNDQRGHAGRLVPGLRGIRHLDQ
jgi:hypothetical protein